MIIFILYSKDGSVLGAATSHEKIAELIDDLKDFSPEIDPGEYHSYVDGYYTNVHRVYKI